MRAAALAVIVGTLAAASAPASAATVPHGFLGVTVDGPMFDPATDVPGEVGRMVTAGAESITMEVNWAALQPLADGPPDFARNDRVVLEAARRRLGVLGIALYAPEWARREPPSVASPPRPAAYAAFLRALVGRYGPAGTLWREHPEVPKRPVRDWQVWNEPSHEGFWSLQPSTRDYVALLRVARTALRGADPGARVVLAGLVYKSWLQLRSLYAAGARGQFDVLSLHPYTRRLGDVVTILRRNRRELDAHGDRRVPMLVTELSWPSSVGKASGRFGYETTEAGQATHVREALPKLAAERRRLRLERVYWFSWLSAEADPEYPFDYAGLRGMTTAGPRDKPALGSFRKAALALEGCRRKGATTARCG
jgi:hypothetical protein